MTIAELATSLSQVEDELSELEIDLLSSDKEKAKKEEERDKLRDELLFYNEFKELYEKSEELELDVSLLYPFKQDYNEENELVYMAKTSDEYKEDVNAYLEALEEAYKDNKIDAKTFHKMRKDAIKLAEKQMDRIQEEEEEKKEDIDINEVYEETLESIEDTKKAFIYNQIGEESYGLLQEQYKNMQEVDKRALLGRTHVGLCKEMGIECDFDFTKYNDMKEESTVSKDGYCIKARDLNGMPYPLDTMLLEQTFKLHIKKILDSKGIYSEVEKTKLTTLLMNSLVKQKELVFEKAKRRELNIYNS